MQTRPPLPPFSEETARQKVQAAEDAWNTRDPERVALAYTEDTEWRNRSEFLHGRGQVVDFLRRKWAREHDYRLRKELWAFAGNRIAVRFEYEFHDDAGRWYRAYGNENWEFAANGLMQRRFASINDVPISEAERKFRWDRPAPNVCAPPNPTTIDSMHPDTTVSAPDLTRRPPRSPRVRLGGYAMLPRLLDKARASLAGTSGEYKYGSPMDRHFFGFTGLTPEALLEQARTGAGDWELLLRVTANASPSRAPHEIHAWSAWLETMPVGEAEDLEWFAAQARRLNPARADLLSIMDYLDADDHVSHGGRA